MRAMAMRWARTGLGGALLLSVALAVAPAALAAPLTSSPYASTSIGADLSWPNCSQSASWPAGVEFGIVGVTGGRAFTSNSCFGAEWSWATSQPSSAGSGPASIYMNLNAPVGSTASYAKQGPLTCGKHDALCTAYDYGWVAAKWAYSQAGSAVSSAAAWWLDVETGNSWSRSTAANDQVIQGAIDYLGAGGEGGSGLGLTVGVYSTNAMWNKIAGSTWKPTNGTYPVPTWYATAVSSSTSAESYCTSSYAFTGGPVWLVQYLPGTGFDADYAC